MQTRNQLDRIIDRRQCEVEPVQVSPGRWRYPWADLEPGMFFVVLETDRAVRKSISAAAWAWGRKSGARFATGPWRDDRERHIGWWCARVDGAEIGPHVPTWRQAENAEWHHARKEAKRLRDIEDNKGRIRRQRIEPIAPLVTATEWSQPVAAPDTYADWDKPREPGEVF